MRKQIFKLKVHTVKSVQIRSISWPYFPALFSRIRTEYGPENTPYLDTFLTVTVMEIEKS